MKKILITGGTGFIGSHLAEKAVKKGYKVIVFDRYNPNFSLGNLSSSRFKKKIEFIFGDIRDYDSVYKSVKKVDYVFHLAALIGIPYSYYSPLAYVKTNIEGTYNILEACKENNIKQVIVTSTSEVYGSAQTKSISETHRLKAQSPYAASKISADNLALSYYNSFQTPVKIIRPFNCYGPRQSLRAVIPTIISQALFSNKILIGNTFTSRDYTYVEDLAEAYFEILGNNKFFGNVTNIGSNNENKVLDIIRIVKKNLNQNIKVIKIKQRIRPKKSEVIRLRCNNQFFIKNSSWKPKFTFEDGIINTIKWIKNNVSKEMVSKYII
jgi:NAD dependent epimerase/dehydratase